MERERPDLDQVREELERERPGDQGTPPSRREDVPLERVRESEERVEPSDPPEEADED